MSKVKCDDCGRIFDSDYIKWVNEDRGEFWGMPAYEDMPYCPECNGDNFREIKFRDVYDTPVLEHDTYYQFGNDRVAEENLKEYISDQKCTA